jgi:hypothetical protein
MPLYITTESIIDVDFPYIIQLISNILEFALASASQLDSTEYPDALSHFRHNTKLLLSIPTENITLEPSKKLTFQEHILALIGKWFIKPFLEVEFVFSDPMLKANDYPLKEDYPHIVRYLWQGESEKPPLQEIIKNLVQGFYLDNSSRDHTNILKSSYPEAHKLHSTLNTLTALIKLYNINDLQVLDALLQEASLLSRIDIASWIITQENSLNSQEQEQLNEVMPTV